MNRKFKDKIIEFFDKENTGDNPYPYVAIAVLSMVIAKLMNAKAIICVLVAITMSLVLGLVLQLLKKEKNVHNIICYLWATIFLVFITVMIFIIENSDDSIFHVNIKIFISGLAFFLDIFGLYGIMVNKVRSKLPVIIVMIIFTLVAITTIIFLPPVPLTS